MKKKAFTLIELLVVIAIIVLVVASIVGAVHKASKRSGASAENITQSPLSSSVAPPAQSEYSGTQFRISNPEDAALMKKALERAGFKVEPVTDKINTVYKPQ